MTTPAKKPFDAEMPERIYADTDLSICGFYLSQDEEKSRTVKYIRADLAVPRQDVDALIEALEHAINHIEGLEAYWAEDGATANEEPGTVLYALRTALSEFQSKHGEVK